jgi:hypothetical protein
MNAMTGAGRVLLLLAALGAAAQTVRAQPAMLPAPLKADAPSPSPFTVPTAPVPPPPAAQGPPTPTFAPAHLPGPYFEVDPLLDRPPLPQPGCFAELELGIVAPHVKNHLNGLVQFPGSVGPDTVQLGSASLDWTVFPRIEAGYRLPSGFGAFSLSYRFLDSEGGSALHSRLSFNELGLDYSNTETSLWPNWDMKWTLGLRLMYVYFDSRAGVETDGLLVEQRDTNWYAGIGPHVGLDLDRQITDNGLAFTLQGTGTLYLGRLRQSFFEQAGALSAGSASPVSQAVPAVGVFVGLRWQPPACKAAEFYAGYQYEHWWDVGKNNSTTSSGELDVQGLFVRAGWSF